MTPEIKTRKLEDILSQPGLVWEITLIAKAIVEDGNTNLYLTEIKVPPTKEGRILTREHLREVFKLAQASLSQAQWVRTDNEKGSS